jgi:hypothetical protein
LLFGKLPDDFALKSFVGGRVGVSDDVMAEVGQSPKHTRFLAVGSPHHVRSDIRVLQFGDAVRDRQVEHLAPSRDHEEGAVVEEAHVHRDEHWHRQGDDATAFVVSCRGCAQLPRDPLGDP